jgi:hypothetical protein
MQDTEEKQVRSEQEVKLYTAQDFVQEYNALVDRTGFRISTTPVWLARDDGTWSMQIQTSVAQAPKQVQE